LAVVLRLPVPFPHPVVEVVGIVQEAEVVGIVREAEVVAAHAHQAVVDDVAAEDMVMRQLLKGDAP
jgi:hypothetical protein